MQDPDSAIPKPYSSPITFFDRHLDDSLILKKVTLLPSLIPTLSEALDGYVHTFNSKNDTFRSPRLYLCPERYGCLEPPKNATDIAERYRLASRPIIQAASILVVHPDQPDLIAPFQMKYGDPGPPEEFNSQKYSLKYEMYTQKDMIERLESWDLDRKALVLSMWDNIPELAIWDMYALSGQSVLEDMSGLAALDTFPWKHCGTSGHRQFTSSSRILQLDVSKYLWATAPIPSGDGVVAEADTAHPRRSARLKGRPSSRNLPQVPPRKRSARSQFNAWARAVHSDSTFIIFDCGNFLRIGVRRRKTQTLYISELVDICDCSNPPFGKLMVAINAAILHDAVDRALLLDPTLIKGKHMHAGKSRKRQRDATEATVPIRRSRRKLGETPDEITPEELTHELIRRNIALLYFQHGNYHSSSPSFFRRPNSLGRQRSYRYHDCLTVLIGKKLGEGSTGQVYEAQILVDMPSGKVARYPEKAIVKLALSSEQKVKVRHEYAIYRRLLYGPVPVSAGDIPTAFGLFEDIESDTGALILSYNGQPLALRSDPPASGITVSPEERCVQMIFFGQDYYMHHRATLVRILESIHAAGVAHGDIRTWNMVADEEGHVSMIDFDRAKFKGHRKQMRNEHQRLEDLLDGASIDGWSVTSYAALTPSDKASY
ncbi:hypothetical protein EDD18DRAFT_1071315 [Armillaria luteobubalina]|uniref:Protein kinase domain-containing protein n=1 Tax=Armillaria luteobubalina TaxID=153913 RepID=A0AA39Q8E3_9AGAR|nr:hypothetical protein EDD18DRAFT_1071315 [Armillaria luteobubalina]